MPWFLNHYICARCYRRWSNDWSCMCDDDCPHCGARHMSPHDSDNLTTVIAKQNDTFVVMRSSDAAEHHPNYDEIGRFVTIRQARRFERLARHFP